jgi:hypothetical protein
LIIHLFTNILKKYKREMKYDVYIGKNILLNSVQIGSYYMLKKKDAKTNCVYINRHAEMK